ncbi:uncharacterized protein ASPGLDRAFT_22147 [Aspergillus glaucus CBS 516.65]|uniref:Uncharacterized protein n=1 Tax=Aspergillus glaucus CBS 516.65 TaxID=1160497 RepID=A0A1L9VXN1_ASPGL|nr:hypothetical protein ASPGLDRAFT_22147 [Aspergillus glaucus CBS 516.65]OJJ88649.1 hypothetical protein ASPGLDRAFT_22147 [Aspergillus glaucus CBS 516.65]
MKLRIEGSSKRGLVRKTFKIPLANDEWYMAETNGILRTSSGAVQAVLEVKKTLRKHILIRVQKQEAAEAAFWNHKETNSQAQLAMDGYRPLLSLNCHEVLATFRKAEPSYDEYLESTRCVTAFFDMQAFGP